MNEALILKAMEQNNKEEKEKQLEELNLNLMTDIESLMDHDVNTTAAKRVKYSKFYEGTNRYKF